MSETEKDKREYGGFLPLELNPGTEFFSRYEPYLKRFNCVKAALDYLIQKTGKENIYIPYYYCPSTSEAIKKTGINVLFYHLNNNLLPLNIPDKANCIVLLVDYFGVRGKEVRKLASTFRNSEVIIDWAHAFFDNPIKIDRIYNIYSAKKFFGIPDGAYLVSNSVMSTMEALSESCDFADYLLLSYEKGTNAAYIRKKQIDKQLASNYTGMSKLTKGLLQNVDYKRVRIQRESNYKQLFDAFCNINELSLPIKAVPYQFPLLLLQKGREIKKQLIDNHIYVPTLWRGEELQKSGNEFELSMMNDCVFLPIDQRYNEEDMDYIITKTRKVIHENS